jgi:hypothetical protein
MAQWNSPSTTLVPAFRVADYPGAAGEASNLHRFTFHICSAELGLVNPQKSELICCPKVFSMAQLTPITIPTEPIGSIPRPADLIERVALIEARRGCFAWQPDGVKWLP